MRSSALLMSIWFAAGSGGCGDSRANHAATDAGTRTVAAPSAGTGGGFGLAGNLGPAARLGPDLSSQICGACSPPLDIRVTQPDGGLDNSWSVRIRGNDFDCTSTASARACFSLVTPGEYDLEVWLGCMRWSRHVRLEPTPDPSARCACPSSVRLDLQEATDQHCDRDGGSEDAGP